MSFIVNLFRYLVVININAFNTLWYYVTKNWFVLGSLIFIAIFIIIDIKVNKEDIIFDKRDIF